MLPRLCRTGRLRCRRRDADPVENTRPIAWDDGPAYRFGLEMLPDDARKRWLLHGTFLRGDKRISLDKPDLILDSGVMLINGRMAPLDAAGALPWILLMRRQGEIAIPYGDRWEFLKRLYASETVPQIDLPQPLRFPEIECEPQPILRIHKPDPRRPPQELRVRQPGSFRGSVTSGVDWFDLEGQFDYGDGLFTTLPELLRAVQQGQHYVRLSDGSRGMLPENWLAKFGALAELGTAEGQGLRFSNSQAALLDALLAAQDNVSVDKDFSDLRDKLRSFTGIEPKEQPEGFSGILREYQRTLLGWLRTVFRAGSKLCDRGNISYKIGVCKGSEMGTTKPAALRYNRVCAWKSPSCHGFGDPA